MEQMQNRLTSVCTYQRFCLLVFCGMPVGWWWADPWPLVMTPIIANEGVEAVKAKLAIALERSTRACYAPAGSMVLRQNFDGMVPPSPFKSAGL